MNAEPRTMNSDYAVYVNNLSKVYRFYQKPVYRLLEAIVRKPMHKAFSALEEVSFSVSRGSTLGIIGENGAGKSTLLKILARTLSPSSGNLEIKGRVSALLELGAGFHQDLTGRQNIYLNASLMGLSEKEIRSREDEIIDFADIGEFIDRPIKTYSSGMAVRLGFSIATCVDPDILIVDEALSVGDQRFQEKCIARMQSFREAGKTIIVCSHSMYLVNELCAECIWLDHGRIKMHARTHEVISSYLAFTEIRKGDQSEALERTGNSPDVVVESISTVNENGEILKYLKQFSLARFEVKTRCLVNGFEGHLAVSLEGQDKMHIFSAITKDFNSRPVQFSGEKTITLVLPKICLQKGNIWIKAIVTDKSALRLIDEKKIGPLPVASEHPEYGLMWMEHEWMNSH